jgi:hypothetical protein
MAFYPTPVQQRERGHTPCSIGTSLALESLGGFGEYPATNPPLRHYAAVWFNLRTVFRNLYHAIATDARSDVSVDALCDGLIEDIEVIRSTIEHLAIKPVEVVFYYLDFKRLEREFPYGLIKTTFTVKQQQERQLTEETLAIVRSLNLFHTTTQCVESSVYLTQGRGAVALLTHFPVDLLSRKYFSSLTLLESHTGALKPPSQWYTKLTGAQRCHRLPFNRLTLQVMGDQSTMFLGYRPKVKQHLLTLAEREQWSPVTTIEKIRYGLKHMSDRALGQFFEQLLR